MKKHILLTFLLLLAGLFVWAQGVPQGINYQAVARDLKGEPLANHAIGIRIALLAGGPEGKSAYAETHHLTTNDLGLFQLIVGQGVPETGSDFTRVPWAEHEIWMELALDEKGDGNFLALSASRLMAVPYAFHAGTADRIKEDDGTEKTAAFWKVNGNDFTFPGPHFIGTLDVKDFVLKTSNLERMRINAAGDIFMNNSLNVGVDVNVGRDVNAGRDGNFGRNLDVANNAHIGNDLDVDRDANIDRDLTVWGIARFNNTTQSNTKDDGAVIVEGGVGIEKNVNIGGNTEVDGTLGVDGISTFKNSTQSTTKDDGAVVVEGGVGVEKNLNVGGNTSLGGSLDVGGVLTVTNTTESTTKDNGALVVEGGVGIEKNVNIGGNTEVDGTLGVDGVTNLKNTTESTNKDNGSLVVEGGVGIEKNVNIGGNTEVDGTLGVDGVTNLKNTTESTNKDNGSLVVEGGAGIEKNLNVGGNSNVTGNSTIGGTLGVNGVTTFNNTTQSTTKDNGAVVIEGGLGVEKNINAGGNLGVTGNTTVLGNTTTGSLNVNTTANIGGNTTIGGTTGLNGQVTITANLPLGDDDYSNYPLRVQGSGQGIAVKVGSGSPNSVNNFVTFFDSGNNAVGAVEGMDANDLANWPPYIYETASLTAEVVAAGVNIGLSLLPNACAGLGVVACPPEPSVVAIAIAEEILAIANLAAYQAFSFYYLGVSYTTGSADYAEYLERRNVAETMMPGDIVGVSGGKISKHTGNASQFLVISTSPAVLGNMQQPADEARFEKVAFMGQVPAKVRGQVNIGDYILPSGLNDGAGFGVSPDQITAKQYSQIVGVAWSAAPAGSKLSLINLAIGLNTNDVARVVEEQQSKIEKLERDFASLEQRLAALESGKPYPAAAQTPMPVLSNTEFIDASLPVGLDVAQIEEAIVLLEDTYRARGIDVDNHAGLKKLFNDSAYRKEIIQNVQDNYQVTRSNFLQMEKRRN
ncbi:MAG: hypothetical protein KF852_09490 [Saprospiraceae bacterium]|nr:hypothetical protein [Saprospiraceae bacterium]